MFLHFFFDNVGSFWIFLYNFKLLGEIGKNNGKFQKYLTALDHLDYLPGQFRTNLDRLGVIRTILDYIGPYWTIKEHVGHF